MWVIGPTLSADKCFAYAEFKQTPVLGPEGRWSPSVYPTDDEFLSSDRGGKILETDESDEGFHTLKWKTYSQNFQWVDSESLKLIREVELEVEQKNVGILTEFDTRIEKEKQLHKRMVTFFNPEIFSPARNRGELDTKRGKFEEFDMWDDVIIAALRPEGIKWLDKKDNDGNYYEDKAAFSKEEKTRVSKEQFLTARNNFYDIERKLLQLEITDRISTICNELQEGHMDKPESMTGDSKTGIDTSELSGTQISEAIEQCEMFIDDHIGNIQRHIAVDELKMAPFASRMSNPELSYAFSLWCDVKNQRLNKAATVFSVPRTPW